MPTTRRDDTDQTADADQVAATVTADTGPTAAADPDQTTAANSADTADAGGSAAEDERRDAGSGKGSTYRRTGDPGGPVRIRGRSAADQSTTDPAPTDRSDGDRPRRRRDEHRGRRQNGLRRIDASPADRQQADRRRATGRRSDRIGGVAPWVPPQGRLGRRLRMREWSRRGFVPLSPGRQKLRHRILPRTVIGIAFMLLATAVGAAFSGAAFYAYYDNRLAENERTVGRFVEGFDQQFSDAAAALDEMRVDAVTTIRDELEPLEGLAADATGVVGLPEQVGPSVWLVETRDGDGRLVVGSAFAVAPHRGGTALITSYEVVRAATIEPGPAVEILKGDRRVEARVWSWDESLDVALIVVDETVPPLPLAGEEAQVAAVGGRVFAVGGFGGRGASAVPGVLVDRSSGGLQHTAPIGTLYAGGPLLDGGGRVLGMASAAYSPLGVDPGAVGQSPDVLGLCAELLRCADDVAETIRPQVADG